MECHSSTRRRRLASRLRLRPDGSRAVSVMGKIRKWKGPGRTMPYALHHYCTSSHPRIHAQRVRLTPRSNSEMIAVKPLHTSWDVRMKQRADRTAMLAAQKEVDETIRAEKRADREAREAREKKKQENKERGLQYQVITNTAKIKKMSKKQLRSIKKADTSGVAPKIYGKAAKAAK